MPSTLTAMVHRQLQRSEGTTDSALLLLLPTTMTTMTTTTTTQSTQFTSPEQPEQPMESVHDGGLAQNTMS